MKKPARFSKEWNAARDATDAQHASSCIKAIVGHASREARIGRGLDLTVAELDTLARAEEILRGYAAKRHAESVNAPKAGQ